jgi:hypothetical protein
MEASAWKLCFLAIIPARTSLNMSTNHIQSIDMHIESSVVRNVLSGSSFLCLRSADMLQLICMVQDGSIEWLY